MPKKTQKKQNVPPRNASKRKITPKKKFSDSSDSEPEENEKKTGSGKKATGTTASFIEGPNIHLPSVYGSSNAKVITNFSVSNTSRLTSPKHSNHVGKVFILTHHVVTVTENEADDAIIRAELRAEEKRRRGNTSSETVVLEENLKHRVLKYYTETGQCFKTVTYEAMRTMAQEVIHARTRYSGCLIQQVFNEPWYALESQFSTIVSNYNTAVFGYIRRIAALNPTLGKSKQSCFDSLWSSINTNCFYLALMWTLRNAPYNANTLWSNEDQKKGLATLGINASCLWSITKLVTTTMKQKKLSVMARHLVLHHAKDLEYLAQFFPESKLRVEEMTKAVKGKKSSNEPRKYAFFCPLQQHTNSGDLVPRSLEESIALMPLLGEYKPIDGISKERFIAACIEGLNLFPNSDGMGKKRKVMSDEDDDYSSISGSSKRSKNEPREGRASNEVMTFLSKVSGHPANTASIGANFNLLFRPSIIHIGAPGDIVISSRVLNFLTSCTYEMSRLLSHVEASDGFGRGSLESPYKFEDDDSPLVILPQKFQVNTNIDSIETEMFVSCKAKQLLKTEQVPPADEEDDDDEDENSDREDSGDRDESPNELEQLFDASSKYAEKNKRQGQGYTASTPLHKEKKTSFAQNLKTMVMCKKSKKTAKTKHTDKQDDRDYGVMGPPPVPIRKEMLTILPPSNSKPSVYTSIPTLPVDEKCVLQAQDKTTPDLDDSATLSALETSSFQETSSTITATEIKTSGLEGSMELIIDEGNNVPINQHVDEPFTTSALVVSTVESQSAELAPEIVSELSSDAIGAVPGDSIATPFGTFEGVPSLSTLTPEMMDVDEANNNSLKNVAECFPAKSSPECPSDEAKKEAKAEAYQPNKIQERHGIPDPIQCVPIHRLMEPERLKIPVQSCERPSKVRKSAMEFQQAQKKITNYFPVDTVHDACTSPEIICIRNNTPTPQGTVRVPAPVQYAVCTQIGTTCWTKHTSSTTQ